MSKQVQVALRTKKIGVLIRDARLAAHKTLPECAQLVGVSGGILRSWEEGRRAPSLPELELLAYSLHINLQHFWSKEAVSDDVLLTKSMNLPALIGIRQRLVGVHLRQLRENASLSLQTLSEQAGISTARLRAYEMGERPIPLPELEVLVTLLGGQIEALFDQTGPIGKWMVQQKAVQDFLQLPTEVQDFVSKPANSSYLKLAMKLGGLPIEKLRSVAGTLLKFTS
jgi:transcriptional regulator with XRE-family HTH domain